MCSPQPLSEQLSDPIWRKVVKCEHLLSGRQHALPSYRKLLIFQGFQTARALRKCAVNRNWGASSHSLFGIAASDEVVAPDHQEWVQERTTGKMGWWGEEGLARMNFMGRVS